MGLSGAGKTTFTKQIVEIIKKHNSVQWVNADDVRTLTNDWDFSTIGRLRQANRIANIVNNSTSEIVICDFIAPLPESRSIFNADFTIWLNTISKCKYTDTNNAFIAPKKTDLIINDWNYNVKSIAEDILTMYN